MSRGPDGPLDRLESRDVLSIIDATGGSPDIESFRRALVEGLRRAVDPYGICLCHRIGGPMQTPYSRPTYESTLDAADPACHDEHRLWLEGGELPPIGFANRDLPEAVLKSFATFQVVWRNDHVSEAMCARLGGAGAGGPSGLLILTFDRRSPEALDSAARVLGALRRYVHRTVRHFEHLQRLGRHVAAAEQVGRAIPVVVLGPAGRLDLVSAAAEGIFLERTGRTNPPRAVLARIAAGMGAPPQPFAFNWRDIRIFVRALESGVGQLATFEVRGGATPERVVKAARALGIAAEDVQLVGLVCEGFINKEIADRLGLHMQTVKNRLRAVFDRTGARNRADLVRLLLTS